MQGLLRSSFIPGLFILCVCACFLFTVKYQVQQLNKHLKTISEKIVETKKDIHILKAELTYLGKPEKLKKIIGDKLNLVTPSKNQIMSESKFKQLIAVKIEEAREEEVRRKIEAKNEVKNEPNS
jgi:cell division protein FtsL